MSEWHETVLRLIASVASVHKTDKKGECEECGRYGTLWEVQTQDGGSIHVGSTCVKKYLSHEHKAITAAEGMK